MGERTLTRLAGGGGFFEGPRWHDGRWWVSDFYRQAVFTYTTEGRERLALSVANQPSGLGWLPDGSLVVVSMKDRLLLRRHPDGTLDQLADLSTHVDHPLNDMVVDGHGHAWVGNFGFDLMNRGEPQSTDLLRVDVDGTISVAADGLMFPNGSVVTPDGRTLIVGETMAGRFTAWTIADDGALSDRRVWAEVRGVGPDGCCLDAEGRIWVADGLGGDVLRVAPGGEVVERIATPEGLNAYACMLGGDDGRTLLLCAAPDFFEHRRARAREAVLLTTTVDVPHAGFP